ncbi:hypothetical protein ACQ4PT_001824 [Festuca glaucescens]
MEPPNDCRGPSAMTNPPCVPEDSSEDGRSAARASPAPPPLPSSTPLYSSAEGTSEPHPRCGQTQHDADNTDEQNIGEDGQRVADGSVLDPPYIYSDDSDEDEDPFLTDSYGNLTTWRLSDMEAAFEKHLEEEARKPKETRFVFDEIKGEVYVIEDGLKFYEHFNFTAKQAGSTVLFFAEVVPSGDTCDVLCCKPLDSDDNGHCLSCENQHHVTLRHPTDEALYVGGHEDCQFPFILESSSEDDSD